MTLTKRQDLSGQCTRNGLHGETVVPGVPPYACHPNRLDCICGTEDNDPQEPVQMLTITKLVSYFGILKG